MTTVSTKMEPAGHRIKRILKSYEESAERTLNGPTMDSRGGRGSAVGCRVVSNMRPVSRNCTFKGPLKRSGPVSGYELEKQTGVDGTGGPGLPKAKLGKCDIVETNLEGQKIACFEVGGEQRLCMPQILSTALRDFDPNQVFGVCEELHIFFTRCDADQLDALKQAKILPHHVSQCGLITYTNAERICSTLLRNQAAYKYRLPVAVEGLKVYHECFGGCQGVLLLEAFTFLSAQCIQCAECGTMFAPAQFVSHSHSELENGTIHWGFSPTNWRSYLMLSFDEAGYPRAQELLDSLKSKFEDGEEKLAIKQEVDSGTPVKRIRYDKPSANPVDEAPRKWLPSDVNGAWQFCMTLCKQLNVHKSSVEMKPPPFLYTDDPVLADPDRVVPYAENQWAERNFAPNVSLEPSHYKQLHDLYDSSIDPEPMEDEKEVAVKPPHKWPSSLSSSAAFSSVLPSADSGNVSDDDSDDTDSVLSDKLPPVNDDDDDDDDDDDQICSKISSVSNARLGILIQALEGEVQRSAGHDPMHDFMVLQKQHSEIVASLTNSNDTLLQRHRYLYSLMEEKVREMEEVRKNQDEELIRLKQETAMKMREAMLDRCRLMQQIEKLSNGSIDSDLAVMATKYKEEAELLRKQLQNAEELNANLRREISELHRAIDKFTRSDVDGLYMPLVVKSEVGSSERTAWGPTPSSITATGPSVGSNGV